MVRPPVNIVESSISPQSTRRALAFLGKVYIAPGFKFSSDTFLKADTSCIRSAQPERIKPDGYFEGAPALAIEVASEPNTAAQLDLKLELYFAHGAEEVGITCLADPPRPRALS